MTDEAISREPLSMAPEGKPVRLVFCDKEGRVWRSERPFILRGQDWFAAGPGGLRLSAQATVIGWTKEEASNEQA